MVKCLALQASLYPGEEDIENWLFGESTMSALLTYQVGSDVGTKTIMIYFMILESKGRTPPALRRVQEDSLDKKTCSGI